MDRRRHLFHLRQLGGQLDNGTLKIGGKGNGYRLFSSHVDFFSQISRTDIRESRARDGK